MSRIDDIAAAPASTDATAGQTYNPRDVERAPTDDEINAWYVEYLRKAAEDALAPNAHAMHYHHAEVAAERVAADWRIIASRVRTEALNDSQGQLLCQRALLHAVMGKPFDAVHDAVGERAFDRVLIDAADQDDDTTVDLDAGDAPARGVDLDKLAQLRALKAQKGSLKSQTEDLEREIRDLEQTLVGQYGDAGMTAVTVEGYTASVGCRTWWGPDKTADVAASRVCEVLEELGGEWATLVSPRYSSQALSSHINALVEQGTELPEELTAVVTSSDVWSIGFRKAAQRRGRASKPVPTSAAAADAATPVDAPGA